MFFFKNHSENETGSLVPDLFLLFEKASYEIKASGLQRRFTALNLKYSKNKLYTNLDY